MSVKHKIKRSIIVRDSQYHYNKRIASSLRSDHPTPNVPQTECLPHTAEIYPAQQCLPFTLHDIVAFHNNHHHHHHHPKATTFNSTQRSTPISPVLHTEQKILPVTESHIHSMHQPKQSNPGTPHQVIIQSIRRLQKGSARDWLVTDGPGRTYAVTCPCWDVVHGKQ
ncbi:hypothetical protein BO94DRAFT_349424 [Aspergillus sclerotioniger CBS 115572]|uniref:Uncharacterized protein n=1 Tax=Aspergillus sclerotioniger CBS 115572 TaxID=1450535 RepID=A0A317X826_9EURO|nr:hypothetical protein BO94DRAFT_349424 [Aspergillus sclerotioniger CBS 115572]PWY93697.1 hypothetical protein BO94DRAFT_349424 [Aspergillus sclerotioniger CBS 115572]